MDKNSLGYRLVAESVFLCEADRSDYVRLRDYARDNGSISAAKKVLSKVKGVYKDEGGAIKGTAKLAKIAGNKFAGASKKAWGHLKGGTAGQVIKNITNDAKTAVVRGVKSHPVATGVTAGAAALTGAALAARKVMKNKEAAKKTKK